MYVTHKRKNENEHGSLIKFVKISSHYHLKVCERRLYLSPLLLFISIRRQFAIRSHKVNLLFTRVIHCASIYWNPSWEQRTHYFEYWIIRILNRKSSTSSVCVGLWHCCSRHPTHDCMRRWEKWQWCGLFYYYHLDQFISMAILWIQGRSLKLLKVCIVSHLITGPY